MSVLVFLLISSTEYGFNSPAINLHKYPSLLVAKVINLKYKITVLAPSKSDNNSSISSLSKKY